jgi:hypothetical protein
MQKTSEKTMLEIIWDNLCIISNNIPVKQINSFSNGARLQIPLNTGETLDMIKMIDWESIRFSITLQKTEQKHVSLTLQELVKIHDELVAKWE